MKFLKFLLIVGAIFIYANWETYGPKINNQIDIYIPSSIQESISSGFNSAEQVYLSVTNDIDSLRSEVKDWSLEQSNIVVTKAGIENPKENTYSPVLSNLGDVVSSEISIAEKVFALLLIALTLVTWNRAVTLVILGYLLYKILKTLFSRIKQKRKKSFFDRIGENLPKDEYNSDEARW